MCASSTAPAEAGVIAPGAGIILVAVAEATGVQPQEEGA